MSNRRGDVVGEIVGRGEEFDGLFFDLAQKSVECGFLVMLDEFWRPGMVIVDDKSEDRFAEFLCVVEFLLGDGYARTCGDVSVTVRVNANELFAFRNFIQTRLC